jgi:hypothetical protein
MLDVLQPDRAAALQQLGAFHTPMPRTDASTPIGEEFMTPLVGLPPFGAFHLDPVIAWS